MEEEDTNVEMLSYKNTIISSTIKDIIKKSLSENLLQDIDYSEKKCDELIKLIADDIKNRLKALPQPRYKFVVQVVIGERREQGIRYGYLSEG